MSRTMAIVLGVIGAIVAAGIAWIGWALRAGRGSAAASKAFEQIAQQLQDERVKLEAYQEEARKETARILATAAEQKESGDAVEMLEAHKRARRVWPVRGPRGKS